VLAASLPLAPPPAAEPQRVVVGGKGFTEQLLMAEMTAQLLRHHGFDVDKRDGLGSTVLREAQVNGEVDVYWEYTGTSLIVYNGIEERMSPEEPLAMGSELEAERGLVWLEPSAANNTYALAMNPDRAEELGIGSISDLAERVRAGDAPVFAVNEEFPAREDGLLGMQEVYEFDYGRRDLRPMATGLTYQALNERQVDVALVFATDGRIAAFNFVVLEDDRGFFPDYAMAPVIRADTLDAHPELQGILEDLAARLDDGTMQTLNARIDVERMTIEEVAAEFLADQGLV
jgi:osmoprotectant transport system substrate-binding protein